MATNDSLETGDVLRVKKLIAENPDSTLVEISPPPNCTLIAMFIAVESEDLDDLWDGKRVRDELTAVLSNPKSIKARCVIESGLDDLDAPLSPRQCSANGEDCESCQ